MPSPVRVLVQADDVPEFPSELRILFLEHLQHVAVPDLARAKEIPISSSARSSARLVISPATPFSPPFFCASRAMTTGARRRRKPSISVAMSTRSPPIERDAQIGLVLGDRALQDRPDARFLRHRLMLNPGRIRSMSRRRRPAVKLGRRDRSRRARSRSRSSNRRGQRGGKVLLQNSM